MVEESLVFSDDGLSARYSLKASDGIRKTADFTWKSLDKVPSRERLLAVCRTRVGSNDDTNGKVRKIRLPFGYYVYAVTSSSEKFDEYAVGIGYITFSAPIGRNGKPILSKIKLENKNHFSVGFGGKKAHYMVLYRNGKKI